MRWRDDTEVVHADPVLNAARELHAAAAAHDLPSMLLAFDRLSAWLILRHGSLRPRQYEEACGEQPADETGCRRSGAPTACLTAALTIHED